MNSNLILPFIFKKHLHPDQAHIKCPIVVCGPMAIGLAGAGLSKSQKQLPQNITLTRNYSAQRRFHLKISASPKNILFL